MKSSTLVLIAFCYLGQILYTEADRTCEEPSQRLLSFLYMFSGSYSSAYKTSNELNHHDQRVHDVINPIFRPVYVRALMPNCVFYLEEVDNGRVFRMQIFVIKQDSEGIIRIQPYNFTDPTKYSPGEFDVADLENVTLDQMSTSAECQISFMQTEVDVFVGTFPDCTRHLPDGTTPNYAFVLSCSTIDAIVYWPESREGSSRLPYDHRKIFRYPLLDYMTRGAKDFKPPCNY
ncbi:uncharacterized protein LOC131950256 [Physella acuta]|uniref:uncharacterized protein LOC131950256 n=1 Tax=Physella acuta TaxID=109671 RepID=UPI0027DCFB3B|nr:uncharacterized protein LOC131950256 [Physella acuta]